MRSCAWAKAGLGWGMLLLVSWLLQSVALSVFLALWLPTLRASHSGLSPFQYTSGVRNGYLHFTRNQVIFNGLFGVRLRVWAGVEDQSFGRRGLQDFIYCFHFLV